MVFGCFNQNNLKSRFPWGFVFEPLGSGDNTCPVFEFFGTEHQYCLILDVYVTIRPAVLIGLISYAIFLL